MFRKLQDDIKTLSAQEIKNLIYQKPYFKYCAVSLLIEYGRINILKQCINTCTYQNVLESIYYKRFNAIEHLLNIYITRFNSEKFELATQIGRQLMSHILNNGADKNIHIIQSVFLYIIKNNLHSLLTSKEYTFIKGMANVYNSRIEKAKKTIYYGIINVICNPNHKIGYRLILKEYNDTFNEL